MSKNKAKLPQQARMADVAKAAGVSPITVSRALSNPDQVAPETRERIERAIRETGYLGNSVAGSLRSRRTNLVVAVIPSITHQFLASMIQGMSEVLTASGLHLVLGTSSESLAGEEKVIRTLLPQRPCGLVLHNTAHSAACRGLLAASGVPVVETGDLVEQPLDIGIGYSNFEATRDVVRHLVARGRRRIAFVSRAAEFNERTDERKRGYRAALEEAGLAATADLLFETEAGVGGGAQTIAHLVERRPDVDAVFFAGPNLAAGAVLECGRRGWEVPGRIAIAGYDDSDLARSLRPTLTTLRVPREEIGRAAAQAILDRLAGRPVERRLNLGYEVCVRDST